MDAHWLRTQFARFPHKKKSDLARKLGLDAPAISKVLAGTREIKAREYEMMKVFFGVEDSTTDDEHTDYYRLKPLIAEGFAESDNFSKSQDWQVPAAFLRQYGANNPEQIRLFQIEDSAMEPDLKRGETLLIDLSKTKASPPGYFLISDGVGQYVRSCRIDPGATPPRIEANRPGGLERTSIQQNQILGRVIARLQWL